MTIENGLLFSFYTAASGQGFPDRLEVRYSTNGASSDVGSSGASVGDFSNPLITVNPDLGLDYPDAMAWEGAVLAGLGDRVTGRFAFRYFIPDTSINANFIGIDTVRLTAEPVPEPSSVAFACLASRRSCPWPGAAANATLRN